MAQTIAMMNKTAHQERLSDSGVVLILTYRTTTALALPVVRESVSRVLDRLAG